jgi:GDP-D-mannose 3',5'-epimerase
MKTALILGGAGFIGHHLAKRLTTEGYSVRVVDLKYPEYGSIEGVEYVIGDLRDPNVVRRFMVDKYQEPFIEPKPFDEVYQLAADMGGAGYIFTGEHDADVMHNSAQINLNVAHWATVYKVPLLFYSSSACMYPQGLQNFEDDGFTFWHGRGLKESDAYPANPDSEYGWEKLFSERLYLAYQRNYNLNVRIARFHNIYGPEGTYKGGKEKAPAAICRKVIERDGDKIEIWGDGEQTRSFLYIDDCIDAVRLLMQSEFKEPINIGSEEMVSINELAKLAMSVANNELEIIHIDGPTGVRGRNSNNDLIRKVLNWEPKFSLADGIAKTYWWIKSQYDKTA